VRSWNKGVLSILTGFRESLPREADGPVRIGRVPEPALPAASPVARCSGGARSSGGPQLPNPANDAGGTLAQAKALHSKAGRLNFFVKIPGTGEASFAEGIVASDGARAGRSSMMRSRG
jgi:hypothetical protein